MRRRDLLAGAGSLALAATSSFPAPAIAQGVRELKMVTDWPETMPGLQTSALRFASIMDWSDISERAYMNSRGLA